MPNTRQSVEQDYDTLVMLGKEETDNALIANWRRGTYALTIESSYGESLLTEYAKDIGIGKSSLYNYLNTVKYWQQVDTTDAIFHSVENVLERYPALSWGYFFAIAEHYRHEQNYVAGFALLERAATDGWTLGTLQKELTYKRTGERWYNAAEGSALIRGLHDNRIVLDLEDYQIDKLMAAYRRGESVKVKIMVIGQEVNA